MLPRRTAHVKVIRQRFRRGGHEENIAVRIHKAFNTRIEDSLRDTAVTEHTQGRGELFGISVTGASDDVHGLRNPAVMAQRGVHADVAWPINALGECIEVNRSLLITGGKAIETASDIQYLSPR